MNDRFTPDSVANVAEAKLWNRNLKRSNQPRMDFFIQRCALAVILNQSCALGRAKSFCNTIPPMNGHTQQRSARPGRARLGHPRALKTR